MVPPPALPLTQAPSRVALALIHAPPAALPLPQAPSWVAMALIHLSPAALTLTLSSLAASVALGVSHQKYYCKVEYDHEKKTTNIRVVTVFQPYIYMNVNVFLSFYLTNSLTCSGDCKASVIAHCTSGAGCCCNHPQDTA